MNITPEHAEDLEQLKRALVALKKLRARVDELERKQKEPVAIIGIGCRFPGGANTPEAFWQLLRQGTNAIREVPPERWDNETFYDPSGDVPGKTRAGFGGFIDGIDQFDPHFYGISPREAAEMDPQQRLLLETTWEALEDAGLPPDQLAGSKTGVFVGIGLNDYGRLQVPAQTFDPTQIDTYSLMGNVLCISANRISYLFDFHGPSLAVDTACSSSLVATHLAVQSLRRGDSSLALVGGTNLMLSPANAIGVTKFLSPDGLCKFGDSRADGYVRGEGCAVVVLKLLSEALKDGDSIYAVIRGSAASQDGYTSGITVPNGVAQQQLIRDALRDAGVNPSDVDYIEAHGTGTALGDPIELNALDEVLKEGRAPGTLVTVGSVKTNIGHLEAGAGIAGLVKLALSLKYGEIPPSLNYIKPNPHIDFENMCVRVQTELSAWPKREHPGLAGVSSFGFGGTLAHIVLEAPPARAIPAASPIERTAHLLCLSAKNETALRAMAETYRQWIDANPGQPLADLAYAAFTGRQHFTQRLAVSAGSAQQAQEKLAAFLAGESVKGVSRGQTSATAPKVAFLFTGQGAQYAGMGRRLYETQPVFRAALDRCDVLLRESLDQPLLRLLYPQEGEQTLLNETAYTQPALFALEYALCELWRSWGIEPAAVMGHSVGEFAAACSAGILSLEDGLRLIAGRGRAMQSLPHDGAMAAIFAPESVVNQAAAPYSQSVSIAALNGPENIVISGETAAVQAVVTALQGQGIKSRKLVVSHAFHSSLIEPMLDEMERLAGSVTHQAPRIPLVSNLTGDLITSEGTNWKSYWRQHARQPVRFSAAIERLYADGFRVFVEIGPHPTLLGMARRCVPEEECLWLPSLREGQDDWQQILDSLGALYTRGARVDWNGVETGFTRQQANLPAYPFQRQHYWFRETAQAVFRPAGAGEQASHPLLGRRIDSPALQGRLYQNEFSAQQPAYLNDHRIYEHPIYPAAAFLGMALAAGSETVPGKPLAVEEVVIQEALNLAEDTMTSVQIALSEWKEMGAEFKVFSRAVGEQENDWRLHTSGKLTHLAADALERPSTLEAARAACTVETGSGAMYDSLREAGVPYGPAFQTIRQIWRGSGQAVGRLQVHESLTGEAGKLAIHPTLLDGCIQLLAAAMPVEEGAFPVYLPVGVDRFYLTAPTGAEVFAVAAMSEDSALGEAITGRVTLYNPAGEIIGALDGVHLKRTSAEALRQIIQSGARQAKASPMDWLYQVTWQEQLLEPAAAPETRRGSWLIMCEDAAFGKALSENLPNTHPTFLLYPSDAQAAKKFTPDFDYYAGHIDGLASEENPPLDGVVFIAEMDDFDSQGDAAAIQADMVKQYSKILYLTQALARNPRTKGTRLLLVTRGATPAVSAITLTRPGQSPMWGYARTAALEQPTLHFACIDLDPAADADNIKVLAAEIAAADGETEIAYRDGRRYAARLAGIDADAPQPAATGEKSEQTVQLKIRERGILDHLAIEPVDRRAPGRGQVEIRVHAAGLNFRDVLNAMNLYPGQPGELGDECAGVISAVGEGVTSLVVGDEVLAVASGSFGSYVLTPATSVVRKPASMSFVEAATLPITFMTADYALRCLAHLSAGERVLIHAAAGGVGLAAVQIAQRAGAVIFGTAGSPEKRALLESLGVQHVLDSRSLSFADGVLAATNGEGVDVVLNSLSDDFITRSFEVLKPDGRFVEIGKRGIWSHEQVAALNKNIAYHILYLGEVIEREPDTAQSLLSEIVSNIEAGHLQPLKHITYPLAQAREAFRFMAQAKHTGKIVLTVRDEPALSKIRPDATYWISGGLGGIGIEVARWLVQQGARALALSGRRAPSEQAQQAITEMEQAGAAVRVFQADISDEADTARVLAEIQTGLPLRGVFHAAGLLDDGILLDQTPERFARVLAPKAGGSWNLHHLTENLPLDFFVLFSAGAALIGSPGQANYAAANAFLDGLAHYRRSHGQPALSINWGAWSETGMAASTGAHAQQRWAERGLSGLTNQAGLAALETLLAVDLPQAAVLPISWPVYLRGGSVETTPSLMKGMAREAAHAPAQVERGPSFIQRLKDAPPSQRRGLITEKVQSHARGVLGLGLNESPGLQQPLREFGLDSLMAVELRNALSAAFETTLPATLLFDYPTIESMVEYLLTEALAEIFPAAEPLPVSPEPDKKDEAAAQVAELSDEEAEALLLAELEKGKRA